MKYILLFAMSAFFFMTASAQDLPFIVAPTEGTTLPTALIPGQSTTAYYTVTNNTSLSFAITNNFVKYFPPNVTQQLTDATYPDICQTLFTLQPKGQPGDSCTLKLLISAPVQTVCSGTNPHECLFVCMSDKTSCAGTKYHLYVSPAISVAVGNSYNISQEYNPVAYKSTDGGKHWTISTTSLNGAPPEQTQGGLSGVSCVGEKCAVAGFTVNDALNIYAPLSYTSNNSGSTWLASPNVTLPPIFETQPTGLFNQISCYQNSCVVVGNVYPAPYSSPAAPIAYTSSTNGQNWNISQTFPGYADTLNLLLGVSCVANDCAAVGQKNDIYATSAVPLGYYSTNGGQDWNLSSTVFALPGTRTQGFLLSTNCPTTHCVAAGAAFTSPGGISASTNALPLAYTSNNHGQTWSSYSTFPNLPVSGKQQGFLWGVTCSNSTNCLAVGQAYDTYGTDSIPVAYVSTDGGTTWSTALTGLSSLPAGKTQGLLYGISCTNAYCIAVGSAYTTFSSYFMRPFDPVPIVYTSSDNGNTWALSNPLPIPAGESYVELIGVSSGN